MSALFTAFSVTPFQALVVVFVVAIVFMLVGMVFAGGVRDALDGEYLHRDISADARSGVIERRRKPRVTGARKVARGRVPS